MLCDELGSSIEEAAELAEAAEKLPRFCDEEEISVEDSLLLSSAVETVALEELVHRILSQDA